MLMEQLANVSLLKIILNMLLHPNPTNILILKIYLNLLIGETFQVLTMFHGLKINIFQPIVDLVGLKEPQVLLLIESTSFVIEHGLIWLFLLKLSSTVKQVVVATEEILQVFMHLLKLMVFLKKVAKTMRPKILINLVALLFKNVKIVDILKE